MSEPDPQNYLQERFPEMQPITKPPSLGSVNGIGTFAYGHRDDDPESGTYVLTQVFGILFVPLIALGAYRVANAPGGGWYFLGRVPLSGLARNWNWLLAIGLISGATITYFQIRAHSPEHIAAFKLEQADNLAATGKVGQAAEMYFEIAVGGTSHAAAAVDRVSALLDNSSADVAELAIVYRVAIDLHRAGKPIERIFDRGLAQVRARAGTDPAAALKLSDALLSFVADFGNKDAARQLADVRLNVLERILKDKPNDLDVLSELALIHESRRDLETCEKLLAPHAIALGSCEGARILGQIYSSKGKLPEAASLLTDYTVNNMSRFNEAQNKLTEAIKRVDREVEEKLRNKAPGFDHNAHKKADPKTREKMRQEFLLRHRLGDLEIRKALNDIERARRVVPAALDLGMVLLRQGQAAADPEERKVFLEKAEKAFLSIGAQSGDIRDDYRLSLGQVYYWLGKHAEGKKQFDEVLKAHKDDLSYVLVVANKLREVGIVSEARELAEKAYFDAANAKQKFQAAGMRAIFSKDQDDSIEWLEKTDPNSKFEQALLHYYRGTKAMLQGKDAEAIGHLRKATELYGNSSGDPGALNNGALVCFNLFQVTGNRAEHDQGLSMLDRAVALRSDDSVILFNVADRTLESSLWDVMDKSMNLSTLKRAGSPSLFAYLYDDSAGQNEWREKVRADKGLAKTLNYYEKVMLLAPKNQRVYAVLANLHAFTLDLPALRAVDKRLETVELDLVDVLRRQQDHQLGKEDDKLRKELPGSIARARAKLEASQKLGGPTFAVAVREWLDVQGQANQLGKRLSSEEIDQLVKLAETAEKQAPSSGSRSTHIGALLLRAHNALLKSTPPYAMAARAERSLNPSYLIAYGLSRPGPVQDACLANEDVRRASALLRDHAARYPENGDAWTWAVLRKAYPEDAARIAANALKDEVYRLNLKVLEKLNPLNALAVLDSAWLLEMAGQDDEAAVVLEQARVTGVLLPD